MQQCNSSPYNRLYKILASKNSMSSENDKPDDEVMCVCSGTTRGEIRTLFFQGKDRDAISRWTSALSGCGGCEWDIESYLGELAEGDEKLEK